MIDKIFPGSLLLLFLAFASLSAAGDRPLHKPLAPVSITIQPARSDLTRDRIQPGDIVELRVTALPGIAAGEMKIHVRLEGGAKLVSGETAWKGQAAKDEPVTLSVAVRAPDSGRGKVHAVVSLPASHGPRFSSEAEFEFGPEAQQNQEQQPVVKKNSKGRSIIEYE